jgi:hypothetical protein
MSAPARELAQRLSGTDEVLLLWHPESERVELSVRDLATGVGVYFEVAPGSAIDAFHHPYAYVARRQNSDRLVPVVARSVDGY